MPPRGFSTDYLLPALVTIYTQHRTYCLLNMYTQIIHILINIGSCYCFATYEIFQGFGKTSNPTGSSLKQPAVKDVLRDLDTLSSSTSSSIFTPTVHVNLTTLSVGTPASSQRPKMQRYKCPEEELPSNIGPYEVPTERDLVFHIKEALATMFESYHAKALYFLKDIKEASKATADIEKKCMNKGEYRKCVKQVSFQCEYFTKGLVSTLEKQRENVANLTEEAICNVTSMKSDPIQLIKVLAMEEATLEFALPGFLRLLNKCSSYCSKSSKVNNATKPPRHLSDEDLVVMYFLSKNHYVEPVKKTNQKL